MSYAGPSSSSAQSHRATRTSTSPRDRSGRPPAATNYMSPVAGKRDADWQEVALFGAGLAIGVILGAGGALLAAPRTGAETRAALSARAARLRRSTVRNSRNAWDDLRDELRQARRTLKNRKRRKRATDEAV